MRVTFDVEVEGVVATGARAVAGVAGAGCDGAITGVITIGAVS